MMGRKNIRDIYTKDGFGIDRRYPIVAFATIYTILVIHHSTQLLMSGQNVYSLWFEVILVLLGWTAIRNWFSYTKFKSKELGQRGTYVVSYDDIKEDMISLDRFACSAISVLPYIGILGVGLWFFLTNDTEFALSFSGTLATFATFFYTASMKTLYNYLTKYIGPPPIITTTEFNGKNNAEYTFYDLGKDWVLKIASEEGFSKKELDDEDYVFSIAHKQSSPFIKAYTKRGGPNMGAGSVYGDIPDTFGDVYVFGASSGQCGISDEMITTVGGKEWWIKAMKVTDLGSVSPFIVDGNISYLANVFPTTSFISKRMYIGITGDNMTLITVNYTDLDSRLAKDILHSVKNDVEFIIKAYKMPFDDIVMLYAPEPNHLSDPYTCFRNKPEPANHTMAYLTKIRK